MKLAIFVLVIATSSGCSSSDSDSDSGPSSSSKIRLNEILAASDASPDWLELYNSGDAEVDLTGYELRDSTNFWSFAEGKIAAGEFLQVICDGSGVAGKASFKLTSKGEQVSVRDPDGGVVDEVVFPQLQRETSWGRIPDGDGEWMALKTPSPGAANIAGPPSDGSITIPDAGADAKTTPPKSDSAADVGPDSAPDLVPDSVPDSASDLAPDAEMDSNDSDGTST